MPDVHTHPSQPTPASRDAAADNPEAHSSVLDLRVRNHPGTMSHITGLFARRAFNLEAILCVPDAHVETSRMLLLVADEPRVEQLQHQLGRLYDVLEVKRRKDLTPSVFRAMAQLAG